MRINKRVKNFIKYADGKIDFKKFIKFAVTGFINTGVDWLAFALFREVFEIHAPTAQAMAQGTAIVNSYIINKNWTFKTNTAKDGASSVRFGFYKEYKEILKFFAVQGISLCAGYAGMLVLHGVMGLNEYLCKAAIIPATLLINYFGNKLFV